LTKAIALAERVATNAPMTNYALIQGLPRIAEQPADHGFLTESMLAAIAQSAPEAKARVKAFLDGTGPKVRA
jgi:enoyl-CoA hydratase/carnithine racemase